MRRIGLGHGSCIWLPVFLSLFSTGCPKHVEETPAEELSTACYGLVKGGKGSGVVGGPIDGVRITATFEDKTVGPVYSDASGSFTLDVTALFPPGSVDTQEKMRAATPLSVDMKFVKPGFKTQLETVTFPVPRFEEFVFYMEGESD